MVGRWPRCHQGSADDGLWGDDLDVHRGKVIGMEMRPVYGEETPIGNGVYRDLSPILRTLRQKVFSKRKPTFGDLWDLGDESGPGTRAHLGSPRQSLRVDILPDVRQFAVSNGNVEYPMVLERLVRGLDSSCSEADDHDPVSLRYELGGIRI